MIPQLQSIGVNNPKIFIEHHSCTALLGLFLISIPSFHMLSWEIALVKLKVRAISSKSAREHLTLYLLDKLIYGIAKDKIAFQCGMSMQIQIHE